MADTPHSEAEQARQRLRDRLTESQARYQEHSDDETREEYLKAMEAFSKLQIRKRVPGPGE